MDLQSGRIPRIDFSSRGSHFARFCSSGILCTIINPRAFYDRGQLTVSKDRERARDDLITTWKKSGVDRPEDNLILAGTNCDAAILNRDAQASRIESGVIDDNRYSVDHGADRFFEGDRVLFTKNSAPRGIRNGALGTVEQIAQPDVEHGVLNVRLDSGRQVMIKLDEYDHIKLGYAVTTHKSQGMTTENSYVLTDESMQDRELSYVQGSRAKNCTQIFTTEIEAGPELSHLAKTMDRSRQKHFANDFLPPSLLSVEERKRKDREHELPPPNQYEYRYSL